MSRMTRPLLILTLSFSACATAPVTERRQMILVSDDQMNQLGAQGFEEILKENRIVKNPKIVEPVAAVTERIAKASGQKMDWSLALLQNDQRNAFCMPGGKIGVFSGILPIAQTNAGLAAILGHEVAHATAKHGAERVSQAIVADTLMKGVDVAMGDRRDRAVIMAALGLGANFGVLMPFSRKHESEADRIGLLYMAEAGYDPREAIALWERMAANDSSPPEFLSTHPNPKSRIKALKKHLPEAMAIYEKSQKQPTVPLPTLDEGVAH